MLESKKSFLTCWTFIILSCLIGKAVSVQHTRINAQYKSIYVQPEQVHLSLADDDHSMVVTWSTKESTMSHSSFVKYGDDPFNLSMIAEAEEARFVDGGHEHSTWYIKQAVMKNLKPAINYYYHVGSSLSISDLYFFKSLPLPSNTTWSPSIVFFGDMGNENAQSLPSLQEETQRGMYDVAIHVGDFAYDMDTDNARVGDEFMRQIEPIAAYLPYMTCPGNHEEKYNFSNYKNRFSMPEEMFGDMFYSFNIGPIHFVSLSTEYYYYLNYGSHMVMQQYNWVVEDLKAAASPENRKERPWIVVFGHRPMYCTDKIEADCNAWNTKIRVGLKGSDNKYMYGMEDLLQEYKVDVAIWAHTHYYERFWPLYNYTMYNGTTEEPYTNAKAPIHIISGSAGCDEGKEQFNPNKPPYSAYRSNDYGYTRLNVHNYTHLEISQVSDDKHGEIIDHFFVIKDQF